jgi:methyl-accepting chemotaxis protein
MSTPIDSFASVTTRYQEAATTALRSWSDGLHTLTGSQAGLPDAKVMAKQYFDAIQQVLDTQRRFAEALFTVADTARTFSDQAVRATEHAVNAAQAATEGLSTITKTAGEQATATARATKSFAS